MTDGALIGMAMGNMMADNTFRRGKLSNEFVNSLRRDRCIIFTE